MNKLKSILTTLAATTALAASADGPNYIFYFIGDGMGMGPATAAEMYNRNVLGREPLTMYQFPVAGMCLTYSASSPVTDSAAAGTALSTGAKTKNGMLGMGPDTTDVTSIAVDLQQMGYGIGIATSVNADDATPGAFYAHVPNRGMHYDIDKYAAASGYQFMAGAGLRGLMADGKPTDIPQVMAAAGVDLVRGYEELAASTSDKVFLLNYPETADYDIGYTIDSAQQVITLPGITEAGIRHLQRVSPNKFFMMVEGGNIDHALHGNDGATAIIEIINFNDALALAYEFYKQHPDETLIVVTADHDTGGMAVGNPTTGYWANLHYVPYQFVSKEKFEQYCRNLLKTKMDYRWEDMRQYLTENLGFWTVLPVNEEQTKQLEEQFKATFEDRNSKDQKTLYASFNAFAADVYRLWNDLAGFGFVATSHTGNPVPVFAVGVGADRFGSLNNNIEIPATILDIAKQ
ncbi:MAG: alkaline phosphatase [Muribaculaceae bacterium]|nr:alkaline phosphatase [Muribaculaceae bacterium]